MRILLILDQPQTVKRALRDEGFSVDTARSAPEGGQKAGADQYDVIILDLSLLKTDGLELLRHWRRDGMNAHVLVLSRSNALDHKVRALDAGADDYLMKPFQLPELLARVRVLMRRSGQTNEPILRIFDLEIDAAARLVRRGGREIHLTPREYAILHLLAFHRGRVVTRSLIRNHLYEDDGDVTSNVVDVYIRYLRAKIDKGFHPPLIMTRRGVGYLLRKEPDEPSQPATLSLPATPAAYFRLRSV